ncbi:MAG: aldose sugar dehydrogenase [Sphingomonadales bacterium]|jgi:glucose/arabinose dehydrogenase|nr:aldose sugar dehydrogenase [Sphingomonadales bacterium]
MHRLRLALLPAFALIACSCGNGVFAQNRPFQVEPLATFSEPWAMTFLPGGDLLVTEKRGALKLRRGDGRILDVAGVPAVSYGGQGGFGDVVLHPDFARNRLVYLSWIEAGEAGTRGAVVGRGRLVIEGDGARLDGLEVIWRQQPKVDGGGHFSHRIAFGPDRRLYISSGERQAFDPAQDMSGNLGKVVRLNEDGSVPGDNPWSAQGGVTAQIWTLGHRNLLGLAFAPDGNLWEVEMGPQGGDEVNLIQRGRNYGWPRASNGSHYNGRDIPDHRAGDGYEPPKIWWNPSISPSSILIYTGAMFPAWRGDALIGALSGQALIRADIDGANAAKADQWDMGARIREVEQAPDGSVWLLEDGPRGRLLRLTPRPPPT